MKKVLPVIVFWMIGSTLPAQNVVLTYEKHAIVSDNINEMYVADFVDHGNAGKNQVWDLSGMKRLKDFDGKIASAYEADHKNLFPESNIALDEFGNKYYFKLDQNSLESYGMTTRSGRVMFQYDQPYVKMVYPFEFGDMISGEYSGIYNVSGVEYPIKGSYEFEADGYGRLILPNGDSESHTLRVKSTRTYTILKKMPVQYEIITYRWYSDQERFPLAVLQTITLRAGDRTSVTHKAAYKDLSVLTEDEHSISESDQLQISIYPNPAEHDFSADYAVESGSAVLIELYDHTGRKVSTLVNEIKEAGHYTIRVKADDYSLQAGTYLLRTMIGDKTTTKTIVLN